jgi:hypothetical protein
MLIDFVAFMAKLLLALIILKMVEVHAVRKNPDAPFAQAMAFLCG